MAHAYTPGLKVIPRILVHKTRRLPLKGTVTVEKGDQVDAEKVVATTDLPGNVVPVNLANILNIDASEIMDILIKKPGDSIREGDLIAETHGIFGLFKTKALSPASGTLEAVSGITGQAIIREAPIPVSVQAYIDGKVSGIIPDEGVEISTAASFIQGIFGIGGERRGTIKVLTRDTKTPISEDMIDESCKGKVLVGGAFLSYKAFLKAQKAGATGIVVGGFNYRDIKKIVGYDIGVAITGQEDINTTLIITEGFGDIHMAQQTFDLLRSHEGRMASINGATQIRAGVIRPEIIIPIDDQDAIQEHKAELFGMEPGTVVRVIRAPYFGMLGEVTELPHELQRLESGSLARVAKVKLQEGGKEVLLPRANLEMIETK
ncbi:MAG: hypothetical protein WC372_07800 [Candidatus Neomarinimicrobiota bacterium]|jgi:hypothetical protein|nr:hypothetical protein [Candidatus Neomarinimicrobiota bacterium]